MKIIYDNLDPVRNHSRYIMLDLTTEIGHQSIVPRMHTDCSIQPCEPNSIVVRYDAHSFQLDHRSLSYVFRAKCLCGKAVRFSTAYVGMSEKVGLQTKCIAF